MNYVCVDSGFLLALYARDDDAQRRAKAREYFKNFESRLNKLVLPWPVMYEVFRSKVVKHQDGVRQFNEHLTRFRREDQLELVDDSLYRDRALREMLLELGRGPRYRNLSLVDRIIRLVLGDEHKRITALVTFDPRDFSDVCRARRIELIS
jgi:predicted nucleic acid-binding protein